MTLEEAAKIVDEQYRLLELRKFIIYKITCKATGLSYVGVTASDICTRWERHVRGAKYDKRPISVAIIKYGKESFDVSVIEKIRGRGNSYLASKVEKYWIYKLNTIHPNGYNGQNISSPVFKEYIKFRETIEFKKRT